MERMELSRREKERERREIDRDRGVIMKTTEQKETSKKMREKGRRVAKWR